jgi:hypothetical protein
VLENFPDLLEDCRDALKEVEAAATKELEVPPDGREGRYRELSTETSGLESKSFPK